jgi:hypothetical protein
VTYGCPFQVRRRTVISPRSLARVTYAPGCGVFILTACMQLDEQMFVEDLKSPAVAEAIQALGAAADTYLLLSVGNEAEAKAAEAQLDSLGAVRKAGSYEGVPRHKIMLCSTVPGLIAMVRQIEPRLHISRGPDPSDAKMELLRFIPSVLQLEPGRTEPGVGSWAVDEAKSPIASSLSVYFGC